jgi:L-threonylcarbamoyladenylate synthase
MEKEVILVVDALKQGKIILYPTDTVWGIGCDATNENAVARIFELKNRPKEKSMIVLLDADTKLNKYVKEVPAVAWDLVEYSENPLSIIYPGAYNLAPNVIQADGTVAIRICKDEFCKQVIHRFGKAIVSTSANMSGQETPALFSEISPEIVKGVDYVVQYRQNDKHRAKASTIIKLQLNGEIQILRK